MKQDLNLSLDILMVRNRHFNIGLISPIITLLISIIKSITNKHFGNNTELIANIQSNILVFRSMVDRNLADELCRRLSFSFFEDSDCSLRKGNTETLCLWVVELQLDGNWDNIWTVTISSHLYIVIFSDIYAVDFGDKFHLFLWGLIQGDRWWESVEIVISEEFLSKCR